MISGARTRRAVSLLMLTGALVAGAGCRTSTSDIDRWADTKQGPRKLVSVLTHDKYPLELRVEAALALVRMKPRGGKRVGILGEEGGDSDNKGLVAALASLPPTERGKLVSNLVPRLAEAMAKVPPPAPPGEVVSLDESTPYKDAAFALLVHEPEPLVAGDGERRTLDQALEDWCLADFNNRVDDSSQLYGVEQVLKYLKADGVKRLPSLLDPEGRKTDLIAKLIADLGSPKTKLEASQRLVGIAKEVASDGWKAKKSPLVKAANEASKIPVTKEQFDAQIDQYQKEELLRVFGSMKRVGGAPIVGYLLGFAKDEKIVAERRAAALAALEGNMAACTTDCDAESRANIDVVMSIAQSDATPDAVRDQALRRVGELPRALVIERLYSLFKNDNWKIRWMAAELVLTMSKLADLPEFMTQLGKIQTGMAITEPLQYGKLIGQLNGGSIAEAQLDSYIATSQSISVRLSALGYYYNYGLQSQLGKVTPFANDKTKVPECKENASGCQWKCVLTSGTGSDAKEELKEVTTLGEFVSYCVQPAMEKRTKADKKAEP